MPAVSRHKTFRVAPEQQQSSADDDDGCTCSLPSWLYHRVFVDLREDDDSFELVLRKIVVSVGLILAIFPVSFALYLAAQMATTEAAEGATAGSISTLCVMLCFPLVWVPTYLVVRTQKNLPDALLDVWLLGTTAGVGILATSFVEYPVSLLALFLAIMALLCSTPRLPLHLAFCFVVYIVAMLNTAFSGLDRAPAVTLLAMPDPYRGTVLERVAYQSTGLAIGLVVLAALLLQTRERRRHEAAAVSAIEMARTVAEQLSIYDVAAVKRTLGETEKQNLVDPELISHLMALADNLEQYRPHLPNWMLNDFHQHETGLVESMEHSDGENGDGGDGEFSVTVDGATPSVTEDHHGGRTSSSEGAGGRQRGAGGLTAHTTAVLRAAQKSPRKSPINAHIGSHRTYFAGRVTMACVSFVVAKKIKVTQREELMASFVDRMHAIANQTNAALHSFIGDQVYVSWNSTCKVFQPEAKASKFLIRAAEIVKDEPLLNLSGAAFTGDARCILAGRSHSAFTVSFRWRETLRALTMYCNRHGAFAVDAATRQATQFDVVTRGIDALLVNDWKSEAAAPPTHTPFTPTHSSTRVVNVYELVREIADSENDEEWMYVLRRTAATEGGDKIINLCLAGEYALALEALEDEMELVRANSSAALPTAAGEDQPTTPSRGHRHRSPAKGAMPGAASAASNSGSDVEDVGAAHRRRSKSQTSQAATLRAPRSPSKASSDRHDEELGDVGMNIAALSDDDAASSIDPYCTSFAGACATSTVAVHGMRLMQHLHAKISRFQREKIPASRFPEDFTSANWKQ